ncbi:MAG: hypothetical protein C7B45_11885 [Sulfobacillus acidophilus]|uniref:MFS transporter n=1 Tax=Sulfobacillus acidophilus TaxID=53633 RepID=A0A2T2WG04_9FIRM|nr:MAG: hypothetical protein C7B45_11885 [Sulfobacillus acidophilus]
MRQKATYGLYFLLSFLSTGLQSIIPQSHFARAQHDTVWVGVCLLAGSIAAIGAVRALSNGRFPDRWTKEAVFAGLVLLWLLLLLGFRVSVSWLFCAIYTASRALVYVLLDFIDRSLAGMSRIDTSGHAQRVAVMQLLGLIAAPIWFARAGTGWLQAAVLTGLLAGSGWAGWGLAPVGTGATGRVQTRRRERQPWAGSDVWFATYILAVASLAALFAASAVFLLHVLYHSRDAVGAAGLLLTLMNLAAVATALVITRMHTESKQRYSLWHVIVALGFFCVTAVLWGVNARAYAMLVLLGMAAGLCYGVFEVLARQDATRPFQLGGEVTLLRLFNNLVNYATVIASLLLLGCSLAASTPAGVAMRVLVGLLCLSALSVAAVAAMAYPYCRRSIRLPLSMK